MRSAGRKNQRMVNRYDMGGNLSYIKPTLKEEKQPLFDPDDPEVKEPRAVETRGTHLPVKGECHECGKRVTGERKFCGRCLSHRKN